MYRLVYSASTFAIGQDDGEPGLPPGTPPTRTFEGPWFTTQLSLATAIGLASFIIFSYCRPRWPLLFAPRTKLKGFSPHEAHAHQAFFGWILPTIRTSEYSVLQIVGLDAAVLLNFFKMSFWLFSTCSIFAVLILMPINLKNNIDIGDGSTDDDNPNDDIPGILAAPNNSTGSDWLDLISDANNYLSLHLFFTYLFTVVALYFIHQNYKRFVRTRQLFSLELVHSIPARTVMITHLPPHLRGERALAEYFENMGLAVESVSMCRDVGPLKRLLDMRTAALLRLESAWTKYVGNPSAIDVGHRVNGDRRRLVDVDTISTEPSLSQIVVPGRKRPTWRLNLFKPKVDALEFLEEQFKKADDLVRTHRRTKRFKASHAGFVTFEKMSSAQLATQTFHAPNPDECITHPAPEPRDIIWSNSSHSPTSLRVREGIVLAAMTLLFFFWFIPTSALASLLSYDEIKRIMPWLGELIDANEQLRALVQNSLPSVVIMLLNALLPFLLEALTYFQGYPARSWIEYSLLKKYFLFLLVNVVFIFLVASTYWQLVRDFANSPAKVIEKLADALAAGKARHFFLSYVILQGLGIMPLQLLNLGVIIPRLVYRLFISRTPRDFTELNAPPMINYGVVYPQAILIFVITLLYSVIQPLILVFGALYFGIAYVVYKYKLLFVFYKPYESQGQAWPITFIRLIWGVVIFVVFMIGIFILKKSFILSTLLAPLLACTVMWAWYTDRAFHPLSKYVNLSAIFEVERGEDTADVIRLRTGHPVTWSQSNLNRRRYAQNDETSYIAPEDERTDYSQPPMANWYTGVLNTGKRRYGHPALSGVLPSPWFPRKRAEVSHDVDPGCGSQDPNSAVVVTLRKRRSVRGNQRPISTNLGGPVVADDVDGSHTGVTDLNTEVSTANPWQGAPRANAQSLPGQLSHRLSYDDGSGVIILPDGDRWLADDGTESDEDEEDFLHSGDMHDSSGNENGPFSVYYHHPEQRNSLELNQQSNQ